LEIPPEYLGKQKRKRLESTYHKSKRNGKYEQIDATAIQRSQQWIHANANSD
jgi:hypothetical protein